MYSGVRDDGVDVINIRDKLVMPPHNFVQKVFMATHFHVGNLANARQVPNYGHIRLGIKRSFPNKTYCK